MNPVSGAQSQQQKDFHHAFFQSEPGRDGERFSSHPQGSQTSMNYLPPMQTGMPNIPLSMDVFQSLMPSLEGAAQAAPQVLLEQQMRLNQLQQLQQLQNQIFQQQLELLSGQNTFSSLSALAERQRDQQQQYGLPTPASSTELRAQPSPDFVSPMLLHSNHTAMGNVVQHQQLATNQVLPNQVLPEYLHQHMIPPTPHSAPANLVFQTNPSISLSSSADLDFSDISPLTSPWLGAYNNSQPMPGRSSGGSGPPAQPTNSKRRNASSSGDESAAVTKPSRKRQSSVRTASKAPAAPKKATLRGTRSANSTPLFPATSRPEGGSSAGDIPGDTPSPIELPPMPPPARLPLSVSTSQPSQVARMSPPSASSSTSVMSMPMTTSMPPTNIMPVTPASIMNLGRLGVNSSLAPHHSTQDFGRSKKKDGGSRGKSSASAEPLQGPRVVEKATTVPLVSPSLKPIRPAGNAPVVGSSTSPTSSGQPVMQFRKSSHKAAEQKRRDSLKTSFDDLRLLLPPIPLPSEDGFPDEPILPGAMPPRGPPKGNIEGPNRGISKLQLLRCGNDYIKVLKGRVERRDEEIDTLRREISRLRLMAGPEAAQAGEEIDLEKDLDAVESSAGCLFIHSMRGFSAEGDDADEEGGPS